MNLNLQGLTVVVTGGSAGIGAAIVRTFAAEGCRVFFCARQAQGVRQMVAATNGSAGKVQGTVLDVVDTPAFHTWLNDIGPIDIFVPNVSALSLDWDATLAIDIKATVALTESAIPHLSGSNHAAITYIGSKASSLAAPGSSPYGAAKAAMAHYMKSMSARLLPTIRVNTVSPGDTLSDGGLWDKVQREEPERYLAVVQRNPMRRLATPDEIARVVAFISSPAASFVSGANWYVDGGSTSHVQI
jgi:NAD(P)-dependent dehydrogenase (short-subunit alcohol dehydrogenase family)